jgi:hypothetical protein
MPLSSHAVGIWLYDAVDFREVCILGADATVSSTVGENAATLILLATRVPIRIVSRVRGLEGQVSGVLMNANGRSAAADRGRFLDFLGTQTTPRRLKFGFRDIPVIIGEGVCEETPESQEIYNISFSFWQVGEYEAQSS